MDNPSSPQHHLIRFTVIDLFLLLTLVGIGLTYDKALRNFGEVEYAYQSATFLTNIIWCGMMGKFFVAQQDFRNLKIMLIGGFIFVFLFSPAILYTLLASNGHNLQMVFLAIGYQIVCVGGLGACTTLGIASLAQKQYLLGSANMAIALSLAIFTYLTSP